MSIDSRKNWEAGKAFYLSSKPQSTTEDEPGPAQEPCCTTINGEIDRTLLVPQRHHRMNAAGAVRW